MSKTTYRIYADGGVYHEDDFEAKDNSQPYYDDYETVEVPDAIIEHIEESMT
jgi:hypothetical protein